MLFLSYLISGISLGSIYAIIALGYTMVYGIAKMLNFAHGDVIMVGAYICFIATTSKGLSPIIGILLAMVVCTVLGILIDRFAHGYRYELLFAELRTADVVLQHESIYFCSAERRHQFIWRRIGRIVHYFGDDFGLYCYYGLLGSVY